MSILQPRRLARDHYLTPGALGYVAADGTLINRNLNPLNVTRTLATNMRRAMHRALGGLDIRGHQVAADGIFTKLRIWARKAINDALDRAYRPGGPGYLRARANFMVNAGQRRRTRRFKPY